MRAKSKSMAKLFGYIRVSSVGQMKDGNSLEVQREQLIAYCKGHGHELVEIFQDVQSGKTASRKYYQQMLSRLTEVDGIIATKLDRLGRKTSDILKLVEDVIQPSKKVLVIIGMGLDTSNPMGLCMLTVFAAFSQLERNLILERTKDGLDAARAKGVHCGGWGFGKQHNREEKKLEDHPQQQEILTIIKAFRASGMSQKKIADELNQLGYRTFRNRLWSQCKVSILCSRLAETDIEVQPKRTCRQAYKLDPSVLSLAAQLKSQGLTLVEVGQELTARGFKTKSGRTIWSEWNVWKLLNDKTK